MVTLFSLLRMDTVLGWDISNPLPLDALKEVFGSDFEMAVEVRPKIYFSIFL